MLLTEKHAQAICAQVLGYIHGAEAEVTVLSEDLSHQRFAANSFTTCGRREDLTVTVSVTLERKQGSASTNDLTEESLKAAVSQAEQLARLAPDFDARSADEGRSLFSAPGGKTKVGERIMDERLNLYSDPWHPELPGSAMASTEVSAENLARIRYGFLDSGMPSTGVPAEKLYQVRNGVQENLSYSRWWAQQKGKEPSPGPVNTILESSSSPATLEEMIKRTERGLLISRFWYVRSVDPRTLLLAGLTRDGMWLIEDGRIRYPVHNFRFNQSVLELLAPGNVEMIGASERVGDGYVMPGLKVKQFHFTSQSEAV